MTNYLIKYNFFYIIKYKEDFVYDTKLIASASMPVLKITCNSKYHFKKIDITMYDEKHNGLECVNLVKEFLK